MITGAEFTIPDLEFGKHQLRIGTNECFPITITNITFEPGYPVTLHAVLMPWISIHRDSVQGIFANSRGEW